MHNDETDEIWQAPSATPRRRAHSVGKSKRDKKKRLQRIEKQKQQLMRRIKVTEDVTWRKLNDNIYAKHKIVPVDCTPGLYLACIRHDFINYDDVLKQIRHLDMPDTEKRVCMDEVKNIVRDLSVKIWDELRQCDLCACYEKEATSSGICYEYEQTTDSDIFSDTCLIRIKKRERERVFG